ncbi:hypothetical protein LSH36_9g02003 [Paralvinella palmiformis]|uniref:Proteasome assembly chaperone 1 n=1 Tax=Paralvinella palmiformis TaxID=53620 RepID=A0AAD9KEA4_9ANNE|nr:hypothetical protein LSH36_9g02003 [Paralvinella palmiformis]
MEYPTFFGETLPVISRAVDDDDDELLPHDINCDVSVRWTPIAKEELSKTSDDNRLECNMLFIAIDLEASGFVETFLLHDEMTELLATVSVDVEDDISDSSRRHHLAATTDKHCFVRRLKNKPSVLFVLSTLQVSQYQTPSWTDQLFSHLSMSNADVVVLTTNLVSRYHSEQCQSDLLAPFLRSLNTSTFSGRPCAPYLEQPNVISGLAAQIMTYLEIHQVSGVLYTCYKDVSFVDIKTMKLFCKILHSPPIRDYAVKNPNADTQLVQLAELHRDKSTLYI